MSATPPPATMPSSTAAFALRPSADTDVEGMPPLSLVLYSILVRGIEMDVLPTTLRHGGTINPEDNS